MLKWNDTDYLYISIYTVFILDDDCKLDAILLQARSRQVFRPIFSIKLPIYMYVPFKCLNVHGRPFSKSKYDFFI